MEIERGCLVTSDLGNQQERTHFKIMWLAPCKRITCVLLDQGKRKQDRKSFRRGREEPDVSD